VAYNLAESNKERVAGIVNYLLGREQSYEKEGRRTTFIEALGNTADGAAYSTVATYLHYDDEDVRVSAVRALRGLPNPEAGADLIEALNEDASPRVRIQAIASMSDQAETPELRQAVVQSLLGDSSAEVRQQALDYLGAPSRKDSSALAQAAAGDPDPEIRRAAQEILGSQRN
jgi:HEAT repeat protein